MRAVITVVGKDMVGILAKVSGECCAHNVNVDEVSQSVLQELFCMIMLVDMSKCDLTIADFSDRMKELGREDCLSIHVMHEDVFNSMHRI